MLLPPAQPHSFNMLQVQFNLRMDIWINGIKVGWRRHKRGTKQWEKYTFPLLHLGCLSTVVMWQEVDVGALELALHRNTILTTSHRCLSEATSQSNIKPLSCLYMPITALLCTLSTLTQSCWLKRVLKIFSTALPEHSSGAREKQLLKYNSKNYVTASWLFSL